MMTIAFEILLMASSAGRGAGISAPKGSPTAYFLSIGVLVVTVIAGSMVVMWVRRRSLSAGNEKDESAGFMDTLRAMHREGKMSDEEFAAAKAKLSDRLRANMDRPRGRTGGVG